MGDDAHQPSLNEQSALQPDELRRFVADLVAREVRAERERSSRIAAILESSGDPRVAPPYARPGPEPPRRKVPKDKRWLHVVRGVAPAALLALPPLSRWGRRLVTGTVIGATLSAGALSPDLMAPAPAPQVPARHALHHHHMTIPVAPAVVLPRRKRRRSSSREATARPSQHPSATPSASPTGTAPPVPAPTPLPTIRPPTPVSTPVPTCAHLTGNHCHHGLPGGGLGAVVPAWARAGLPGLINQGAA